MAPHLASFLAVGVGAVLGAWVRWGVAVWLNTRQAVYPWGTLTVNLVGGYLIGVCLGLLALSGHWPAWVRLAIVTGFLGALTTFSTFSAEVFTMIEAGRHGAAIGYAALSLLGSLALTALGLATVRWFTGA